ncbi:hypothetical protein ABTY96_28435 [Streptomyces sp. NPDC096057]|uniref:hypothetical protein n=1 Tax=Streptomyces sp. NPDC096057 TaxID=3155543 RepID=UPI00332E8443
MERKTRKATSAERLAARAMGQPDLLEVEVETRSTGELHAARIAAAPTVAKPKGMSTAEWFVQRYTARSGEADEVEEEPRPAA